MIVALHFVIGCATHSPYVKYGSLKLLAYSSCSIHADACSKERSLLL
jgi:hypothetical protein